MSTLGEKIKKRRKEMNLTLKELSGSDFSYSLLSQIENNKANPSMETLNKLALKLDIPISDLLDTSDFIDFKQLLKKCEKKFLMHYERNPEVDQKMIKDIEEVIEHLTYNHYEEVRLIEIYCMCSYYLTANIQIELFDKVLNYYDQTGNLNSFFKATLFIVSAEFQVHHYERCHVQLNNLLNIINDEEYLLERSVILDCFYMTSILASAVGNYEEAIQYMVQCFDIAEKAAFYSKHSRYLQHSALLNIQLNDHTKAKEFLNTFKNYVQFTDNIYDEGFFKYTYYHLENRLSNKSHLTKEIEAYINKSKQYTISPIFKQELAYSYWKTNNYQQVIDVLTNFEVPSHLFHPLDIAASLEVLAIRAYCYEKIGNREKAVEEIIKQYQAVKDYPPSTYKESIVNIYKELLHIG